MADLTFSLNYIHKKNSETKRDNSSLMSALKTAAIAGIVATSVLVSAQAYKEGYLPTRELLGKGWTSERIERAYEECENEMPFYWNALSLPGRKAAYFLH